MNRPAIMVLSIALSTLVGSLGCVPQQECPAPTVDAGVDVVVDAGADVVVDAGVSHDAGAVVSEADAGAPDSGSVPSATVPEMYWDFAFGTQSACEAAAALQVSQVPAEGLLSQETLGLWLDNKTAWANEAILFGPTLQQAWEADGVPLIEALVELTGVPFARDTFSVTTHTCLNQNSNGSPLSMSVHYFLPGAASQLAATNSWAAPLSDNDLSLPLPVDSFVELLFHEVLHIYVLQLLNSRQSEIIQELSNESASVRTHVHVFALQQAVFDIVGENDPARLESLARSRRLYAATGALGYTRAWEIVDERGSEPFINDLIGEPTGGVCSFCSETNWTSVGLIGQLYGAEF